MAVQIIDDGSTYKIVRNGETLTNLKKGLVKEIIANKRVNGLVFKGLDGKTLYSFSYDDIDSPVSTDLDDLVDQIESMGDTNVQEETTLASLNLSKYRKVDLAEVEQTIKLGAGTIFGYKFYNSSVDDAWVKFIDAIQVIDSIRIPAQGSSLAQPTFVELLTFTTDIKIKATKLEADTDTTAPTAPINAVVWYK